MLLFYLILLIFILALLIILANLSSVFEMLESDELFSLKLALLFNAFYLQFRDSSTAYS